MAQVFFTANLRRHVDCASMAADGATVREVLAKVFAAQDRLGTMCWMTRARCAST